MGEWWETLFKKTPSAEQVKAQANDAPAKEGGAQDQAAPPDGEPGLKPEQSPAQESSERATEQEAAALVSCMATEMRELEMQLQARID